MKVKTSVRLSPELLAAIDHARAGAGNRSAFLESAAWRVIREAERVARDARDIAILNEIADGKRGEPPDVLAYSVPWQELGDDFTEADLVHASR